VRRGVCGIAADGVVAHTETWLVSDLRQIRLTLLGLLPDDPSLEC
jgi:hypothetical protein